MRAALAGLLLALAGQVTTPGIQATPAGDRVLLVGDRTFSEGPRIVEALDAMVAASGIVAASRFDWIQGVDAMDEQLVPMLEARGRSELRAIIAVVGDLSLMDDVDPSDDLPPRHKRLTSRQIDEESVTTAMDRLEACAERIGVHLVFATAPLGIQGRVETPELLAIAELVREREPVLDLGAAFREWESTPLFANGIDILDAFGHEAAAREIFHRICRDDAILPARSDDERAARASQRALDAWMSADEPVFEQALTEALAFPPTTTLGAVRQAALISARDGLEASRSRWAAVDPSEGPCEIPGVGLARLLCRLGPASAPSCDPIEVEILSISDQFLGGQLREAWDHGMELIARYPHRPEPWITLEIIARATERKTADPEDAYPASLAALTCEPVSRARYAETLRREWGAAMCLPVMLVAGAPYASLTPTGPILDALRRACRLGLQAHGLNGWTRDSRRLLVPPAWHEEADRLEAQQEY